jgi:hypothetical protein
MVESEYSEHVAVDGLAVRVHMMHEINLDVPPVNWKHAADSHGSSTHHGSSIDRTRPIDCTRGPNSAASSSGLATLFPIRCWLRHILYTNSMQRGGGE